MVDEVEDDRGAPKGVGEGEVEEEEARQRAELLARGEVAQRDQEDPDERERAGEAEREPQGHDVCHGGRGQVVVVVGPIIS